MTSKDAEWVVTLEQQVRALDRIQKMELAIWELIEHGDDFIKASDDTKAEALKNWNRCVQSSMTLVMTEGVHPNQPKE